VFSVKCGDLPAASWFIMTKEGMIPFFYKQNIAPGGGCNFQNFPGRPGRYHMYAGQGRAVSLILNEYLHNLSYK